MAGVAIVVLPDEEDSREWCETAAFVASTTESIVEISCSLKELFVNRVAYTVYEVQKSSVWSKCVPCALRWVEDTDTC